MPDRETLLEDVRHRLRNRVGFAVATLNLDHLVKLRQAASFRAAYRRQDLVTADGNPIVWLSRLAGRPVSLVTGSDLVEPLAEVAAQEQVPVALLGATPETLARAAAELSLRHPGLRIVACLAPGQGFDAHGEEATQMIEALRLSGARLTFLALGAPDRRRSRRAAETNCRRWGLSRSGPVSISSRRASAGRRPGCSVSLWNGSGGSCRTRSAWPVATPAAR